MGLSDRGTSLSTDSPQSLLLIVVVSFDIFLRLNNAGTLSSPLFPGLGPGWAFFLAGLGLAFLVVFLPFFFFMWLPRIPLSSLS